MLSLKTLVLSLLIILSFGLFNKVEASSSSYLTIVSLVRSKPNWINQNRNWLQAQIDLIGEHKFASTWLLDYDVIEKDHNELKDVDNKQEIGLLLEVTPTLASKLKVHYDKFFPAHEPQNAFLSGYSPKEKQKIIDEMFSSFKEKFGYFPKSTGAWFIDSWSLNYMKSKYGLEAALIVADQYNTDNETIRGHPWQVPYYPSAKNTQIPASDVSDKQDVVLTQWAAREPLLGWGNGLNYSNYSVQANDYSKHNLDEEYFTKLATKYLYNQTSDFNQLTIGIEVGQEGAQYFEQFEKQLIAVDKFKNLNTTTMKQFAEDFKKRFPNVFEGSAVFEIDSNDPYKWAIWYSGVNYRIGLIGDDDGVYVRDLRAYGPNQDDLSHSADRRRSLFRQTESIIDDVGLKNKWRILDQKTKLSNLEKSDDGYHAFAQDKEIFLTKEAFSFNFKPKEINNLPTNLNSTSQDGKWIFKTLETTPEANNKLFLKISLTVLVVIWLFFFNRLKSKKAELVGLLISFLAFVFLSIEPFSLLPTSDLGLSYISKLQPTSLFIKGVLAYLLSPIMYISLGFIVFLNVKKITKSMYLAILAECLFFFWGSLGFILQIYHHLPIDITPVSGIKNNAVSFVWFFKFPSLDKLFFSFSAGQMNIDFLANASKSWNILLIGTLTFFHLMNLGIIFLGAIFFMCSFLIKKEFLKSFLLATLILVAPFAVNSVDLRLPTIFDTMLSQVGVIGLFMLISKLRKKFKVIAVSLIIFATFSMLINMYVLVKRNEQILFRFNKKWSDKQKTATRMKHLGNLTDVFLWQVSEPKTKSAVFIPQQVNEYFFVNIDKPKLHLILENSYGVIGNINN